MWKLIADQTCLMFLCLYVERLSIFDCASKIVVEGSKCMSVFILFASDLDRM